DLDLLRYISTATRGMCVQGNREEELRRMFLRLFEEMAEPQTIPVREGRVLIDSAIREATFLILHDDAEQVRLNRPDGRVITAQNADADTPWYASTRFDLVTVQDPEAGNWEIFPSGDAGEHRVMVLTDLELQLDDLAPVVKPGASLSPLARLVSEGQTVANPELLSRLVMEGALSGRENLNFRLKDDGASMDRAPGDGWYGVHLTGPEKTGAYDIEIIARAPTLERRIVRHVAVIDRWFQAELGRETAKEGDVIPLKIWLIERELTNQSETEISFEAAVMRPDDIRRTVPVDPVSSTMYTVGLGDTSQTGVYQVTVIGTLKASGRPPVRHTAGPFQFHVVDDAAVAVATPHAERTPAPTPTPEVTQTPEPTHTPEPTQTAYTREADGQKDEGGMVLGLISIVLGVIVVGAGIFSFLKFKQAAPAEAASPSMEHLRKRASEIRNDEYDTAAASAPNVLDEEVLDEPPEEEHTSSMPEDLVEAPAEEENKQKAPEAPPSGEDVEIIPEAEPGSPESVSAEAVETPAGVEEEKVELNESEAELLNEIMGEAESATEEPAAEEETVAGAPGTAPAEESAGEELNSEQNDLLAEIMNETEGAEEEIPQDTASNLLASLEEEPEAPQEASGAEEGLSATEGDLLAEIMGETDDKEENESTGGEGENVAASQSEDDLLSEIMAETQGNTEEVEKTPNIPDESEDKSEQEVIDDILNDIEGMV
ncbi:MAG: choice-of-anchor X domain-containing protein, partial [Candidatus Sumerlaeota bacterium]